MFITATFRTDEGKALGVLVLKPKTFASGKEGWHGQGKIVVGDQRTQAQSQLVVITPKEAQEATD